MILLTDLNSRIPVSIQPGNLQAMLTGDNSGAPLLVVSAQGARLHDGQQVVTSGDGALLPAGLAVGKVFGNGTEFRAALFADAGRSDDVRVLDLTLRAEQPPAPTAGDLPVTAAGLSPLTPAPPKPAAPAAPAPQVAAAAPAPRVAAVGAPPPSARHNARECDTKCLNRKELLGEPLDPHIRRLGQMPRAQQPAQPPSDQPSGDDDQ